ncbi:MAG: hypothetical protein JWQ07_49 [Ramlibacter sp.]|nr:hypothetical protein [Ramlibacter sp.]
MRHDAGAYTLTGIPARHGAAMQQVADRMKHGILLRSVGSHCTRLLEEGYAAKGFRIDTKSCDWGPMRGFVCVDPRLSKGGRSKETANRNFTAEALTGSVRHDAIGGLDVQRDALWTAGCKPIVISAARLQELRNGGHLNVQNSSLGILTGVNGDAKAEIMLPWRLLPVRVCRQSAAFRAVCPDAPVDGYGLFVDDDSPLNFVQEYPGGATPIRVMGFEAILGLINPGTEDYGYRACVTGDYDLFAVWAPAEQAQGHTHNRPSAVDLTLARLALGPGNHGIVQASRNSDWDHRFVDRFRGSENAHHHQHYQLGNITRRINLIKTQLNTTLQSVGGYTGGALVHHSDEVGNPSPGLKKTLLESMPLLAFIPGSPQVFGVENTLDFKNLVRIGQAADLVPDLRPEWANFLM